MKAIYPGSFDPFTYGHADVLLQALDVFDDVVILICKNPNKKASFLDPWERLEAIQAFLLERGISNRAKAVVLPEDGTSVKAADAFGAVAIVRGIRTVSDFEYEMQIAAMNKIIMPNIHTVYFTPDAKHQFTSSSMAREFYRLGLDTSELLPPVIREEILLVKNQEKKRTES